ncbi:hypothetical protein SeLEV6574_g06884 [Synchytrium endobioticum]|uniref:ER membrane protein complex subunit 4 n=1 Tax=Synchytrium endobioticum TaxID=286115 RepID=A0A507CMP1_9FUNG|nr:hypothetical protein SeLEV6574_g06884 [Synchytrium endobioticum]
MSWHSLDYASLEQNRKHGKVADPVGYIPSEYEPQVVRSRIGIARGPTPNATDEATATLKIKKAWDVALAPAKSIPMNGFMLYMSGNSVQIFSILITVMMFWSGIKGIMGANSVFANFHVAVRRGNPLLSDPVLLPKLAFVGMQLVVVAMGLYKCWAMGLLPTSHSDWLAFKSPKIPMEVIM